MKSLIGILAIVLAINSSSMAQEKKDYKEIAMMQRSETINVSADELWEIVGPGFEDAGYWSEAVDHSVGSGTAEFEGATCSDRACDINARGYNKVTEKLTLYNEKNQELAYELTEGNPGFVLMAENHWKVIAVSPNQSVLEMNITLHTKKFMGTLMGGMMKKNINNLAPTIFRDLKVYAETGDISVEKKERMAELAAKN